MRFKKVIAGIMAAALLFSASGCSEARNKKATEAMENAFGSYMSRILAGKNASRFVDAKKEAEYELTAEQDKILKCVLKHAAYEIEESGADAKEGKGRITIEFRYAPAEKIAGKYFDYDLQQVLDDIANAPEDSFLDKKINIDLVRDGDDWLVTKKSDIKFKKSLQEIAENIYLRPGEVPAIETASADKVGISLPTKELARWNRDGDRMKTGLEAKGFEVDLEYASNDTGTQVRQIMDMIGSGCKVIVIAAIDPLDSDLLNALSFAKEDGITVIAYDRLIYQTQNIDYYLTFDLYMIGVIQAQYIVEQLKLYAPPEGKVFNIEFTAGDRDDPASMLFYSGAYDVLEPYIAEGVVNIRSGQIGFSDVATDSWSTDRAQGRAESILGKYYLSDGAAVDAWLCSNDSTALGVENALEAIYTGPYPVITGQDCDIANVKNIINGKQAMSVFKDTRSLADQAVTMVEDVLKGLPVPVNDEDTYDNGVKKVPSYLCSPVVVDINNYRDILIVSGYYTEDMLI